MEIELSDKVKYLIKLVIVTVTVYFSLKYLLPLFLPLLAAYVIAHLLKPITIIVCKKWKIKKQITAVILLVVVVGIVGIAMAFIMNKITGQEKNILSNYDKYEEKIIKITDDTCCMAEKYSVVDRQKIRGYLDKGMDKKFAKGGTSDFIYTALNKSIDTVIMFGEWIVFLFTTVILAYYLITSEINKSENILIKELRHISKKVGRVCLAYVKTQLVIMSITSVICIACFMIIRNKYALLLGILVGFLDALPLIGIGIILVPWGIIYLIVGSYFKAIIILGGFAFCYLVREFVEPKLMCHQIGITPLATVMSMYVGYKIFGIIGVILGPVAYILISTLMEE